jgi:TRAP-type C4-dicarboxylate transport system substrate-binding protein
LAVSVVFLFCLEPGFAQQKPITLNYSMHFVNSHLMAVSGQQWSTEIEKRTNGRVKITMYPGGSLIPSPAAYDGVTKGIADIALSFPGYTKGRFPLLEVMDLPLGCKSGAAATRVVNELFEKFKPKEFDEVKVMYFSAHGPGYIHTRKPVYKLEDLKGMKIRGGGVLIKVVAALGASPVSLPMGEVYDALSRGVVEGATAPFEALEGWKLGEVIKYSIENRESAYTSAGFVIMNKEKWNSLPPDIQKIIEGINKEWMDRSGKLWDDIDKSGREFTLKRGNKIITLTPEEDARWTKALRPVLDEYVKYAKEKGVPGDEALKFCMERLRQLQ